MSEPAEGPNEEAASAVPRRRRRWMLTVAAVIAATVVGIWLIVYGAHVPNTNPAPLPDRQYAIDPAQAPDPVTRPMPVLAQASAATNGNAPWTTASTTLPVSTVSLGSPVAVTLQSGTPGRPTDTIGMDTTASTAWHPADPDPALRQQTPQAPVTDQHLIIPAIGVNAAVGRSGRIDGSLQLPADVSDVTEWQGSAPVADTRGTVLIAGHVDNAHQGQGALYYLHTLYPGDAVYLAVNGVVTRWKVTGMQAIAKAQLPNDVWTGPAGPRQLKLVTCGGVIHHGSYDDNVIVTAVPF